MTTAKVQLRYYQNEAIEAVRNKYRSGENAALIVLGTGCGKTMCALSMAAMTVKRGGRALWISHRDELVRQPVKAWDSLAQFREAGTAGIVQGSSKGHGADFVSASIQTIGRNPTSEAGALWRIVSGSDKPLKLVVFDEAHHVADDGRGMFSKVPAAISTLAARAGIPEPYRLGLTATPERSDGRSLAGLWGDGPAYVYGYKAAIDDGYLCPPRFVLDRLELPENVAVQVANARESEDGVDRETARALLDAGLVDWTVASMARHLRGRSVIAFACDLNQAGLIDAGLKADGWRSAVVSGSTPTGQRRALLRAFERGDLDVLVNCNVLTEGTDLPRCDALVMARPFSSKVLYIQAVGRGLRLYPGKDHCLVLDVLGSSEEHDLTHAVGLLEAGGEGDREPFDGMTRRAILLPDGSELAKGSRVGVEPREDTPEGDDREWLIVDLIVGEDHRIPLAEPAPACRPRDVVGEGDSKIPLPDLLRERRRVEAHWVDVPGASGRAMVADLGQNGRVWLVDVCAGDDCGWMAYHVPKRAHKPRPLDRAPLDLGYAQALGDDLFRQAEKLVKRGAAWRDGPPSEAQKMIAQREEIRAAGYTRGDFSDAISAHFAGKFWRKHGIEKFQREIKG